MPWTQTGEPTGASFWFQMKPIAAFDNRTQPCDAG